jgi:hypothetical protein
MQAQDFVAMMSDVDIRNLPKRRTKAMWREAGEAGG